MKRFTAIWLVFILMFGMTGCTQSTPPETGQLNSVTPDNSDSPDAQSNGDVTVQQGEGKVLIAYFSQTGNTKELADMIEGVVNSDVFVIDPIEPYPDTYEATLQVAGRERAENARPEYTEKVENMEDYDVILLGYPIWGGTLPMIVHTFLEDYDFSGKTVYPFCTSNYGGFFNSIDTLKTALPDAIIGEGFAVRGREASESLDDITDWLLSIGLEPSDTDATP